MSAGTNGHLPPIATQQGAHSATWTPLPFYAGLTLPAIYQFNAEKSPDHPAFVYDDDGEVKTLYHRDVYAAICNTARIVSELVDHPPFPGGSGASEPAPVGILGVVGAPPRTPSRLSRASPRTRLCPRAHTRTHKQTRSRT